MKREAAGRLTFFMLLVLAAGIGARPSNAHERKVATYEIPDVTLVNQDREQVRLNEAISGGSQPVLVDFIFGTCTTICPVMSAGFSNLQAQLGEDSEKVTLISISIDPEHDTPEVMKKYLERYRAKPGWQFLTGSRADIESVMRAFDAFVADKMSHRPLTLLKSPGSDDWVRIDGMVGAGTLMEEYQKLLDP